MRRYLVRVGMGFLVLFVLGCMGFMVPLDVAFALLFGWINYLMRVLPEVRMNWWGVATAVACLVPLAVGSHLFLAWFCQVSAEGKSVDGRRWRWHWTGGLIAIVVLMFVAGLAAGGVAHQLGWLIHSPEPLVISGSGVAAYRAQSVNNLKQIAVALYNYNSMVGTFPPAAAFDPEGRPLHGWQSMILPYLEHEDVFKEINFAVPWDDPPNAAALRTEVNVYLNPRISEHKDKNGFALSHYAGNVRMLGGDARWTTNDVTDGTGNTVMAGEVVNNFRAWGDPMNWRDPALGVNRSPDGFGSPFPGGANFMFVNGSVRFIKNTIAPGVFKALSTPKGGEQVSSEEY